MATSGETQLLSGQVAIVTGGGRGLGRGMAQALAAAGAAVALVGRSEAALADNAAEITQAGGRALIFPADVTDKDAITHVVESVEHQLGPISLLVNNAGMLGTPGPFWETDPDEWWRVLEVNVRGPLLCARAVMPGMVARHSGRIINVASGAALAPIPYGSPYATSKAALARLTECIALEGQQYGITAFAIDPGNVITDMSNYLIHSEPGRKYVSWFGEFMLAGNDDPPHLCANLVVLLASGKLDRLSGRFVQVSDDADLLTAYAEDILKQDLYTLRMQTLPV